MSFIGERDFGSAHCYRISEARLNDHLDSLLHLHTNPVGKGMKPALPALAINKINGHTGLFILNGWILLRKVQS